MDVLTDAVVSGGIAGALISGAMQGPYKTLQDIWYCAIGYKWEFKAEEIRQKHLLNLQKMQQSIVVGIEQIKPSDIQEPQTSILGPALEASRFYMDEDDIREMFAKLIVSSMDKSKNSNTHHAFVDIIKSIGPTDAKILQHIYLNRDETISRVVNRLNKIGDTTTYANHVYLGPDIPHALVEPAIDNLIRLNLVTVSYDKFLTFDSLYNKHFNSVPFAESKAWLVEEQEKAKQNLSKLQQRVVRDLTGYILTDEQKHFLHHNSQEILSSIMEVNKGVIQLTAFGRNFCKVCLSD